jgi:flavin-dependent thymidylate synthase
MKVILAGFNVDVEILKDIRERFDSITRAFDSFAIGNMPESELRKQAEIVSQTASEMMHKDNLTPETLSAAYARISRLPQAVPEIRKASREGVSRARRSNEQIVFEFGHKSVAEHAVYNFDVLGISRLATEFAQNNRLCSFTEKSQRYVRFDEEVFIPPELEDSTLLSKYQDVTHQQFLNYEKLYNAIFDYLRDKFPEKADHKAGQKHLETMASEDARYLLPLATFTQFGMTLNARCLEGMITKANAHPLPEVQEFAQELLKVTKKITPSLIKYTDVTDVYRDTQQRIKRYVPVQMETQGDRGEERVRILTYPTDGDERLLTALLFSQGQQSWEKCRELVRSFDKKKRESLFRDAMKGVSEHDPVWREFEMLDFDFEVILSASAYAQLKRHRMSTQILQPYDPNLGCTIPPSVIEAGMKDTFLETIDATESLYREIFMELANTAQYILTNAHRRRLILHVNARELYHMARLRMDQSAQWEIREIMAEIIGLAQEKCPLTSALACGKDGFIDAYRKYYSESY